MTVNKQSNFKIRFLKIDFKKKEKPEPDGKDTLSLALSSLCDYLPL